MGGLFPSALVSGAATTNDHQLSGLQQEKGVRSQFWGLRGPSRGAGRATLLPVSKRRTLPGLFLVLVVSGDPWRFLACSCITPISASAVPGLVSQLRLL